MKSKKSVIIFAVLIIASIICSWVMAARRSNDVLYIHYTVSEGDTLWEIAEYFGGNGVDTRDFVHEIREANNLDSACIYAGDVLNIPVK